MKFNSLRIILLSCTVMSAGFAVAADPWLGARIMPKSPTLQLRVEGGATGGVYQVSWPATVQTVEGQWLWIEDNSGASTEAVAGWVSKEDVLMLADANDFYVKGIESSGAPWLHWFRGIVLEETRQPAAASAEYLAYLNVGRDVPRWAVRGAVQRAVLRNVLLLDTAMRLARLKATGAKTPADAEDAAGLLAALATIAGQSGIQRPQLDYEQAEALRRAYVLSNSEENLGRENSGPQLAAPGEFTERDDLFRSADDHYQRMAGSALPEDHRTSLRSMIGYLGRGELYLTKVKVLQNLVNKEFTRALGLGAAEKAVPPPSAGHTAQQGSATGKAGQSNKQSAIADVLRPTDPGETFLYDASKVQAYLEMLKQYKGKLKSGGTDGSKPQPERLCQLLARTIASLKTATESFDDAIALNGNLPEAHRDRGAAYLERAQAESVLADVIGQRVELKSCLSGTAEIPLPADEADKAFQGLDRAFVKGQTEFYDALKEKKKANDAISLADQARKDISAVEQGIVNDLAKRYATLAGKPLDSAAKDLENTARLAANLRIRSESLVKENPSPGKKAGDEPSDPLAGIFTAEAAAKDTLQDATAAMAHGVKTLQQSPNLKAAESSLQKACLELNFSGAEELELLASIYSSLCNFDRAAYYQKLAAIFASDDDRPQVLATLHYYETQGSAVTEKAKAKSPAPVGKPAAGGSEQGKGASSDD